MPRPSSHSKVGFLYFIESEEQDAVKIGFADNVVSRLSQIQTGNPAKLTVVGTVRATYGAEQRLHTRLRPRRLHLEWYPYNAFIGYVVNELLDENLDRSMVWLAANYPHASGEEGVELLSEAAGYPPVTADDIDALIASVSETERDWLKNGAVDA